MLIVKKVPALLLVIAMSVGLFHFNQTVNAFIGANIQLSKGGAFRINASKDYASMGFLGFVTFFSELKEKVYSIDQDALLLFKENEYGMTVYFVDTGEKIEQIEEISMFEDISASCTHYYHIPFGFNPSEDLQLEEDMLLPLYEITDEQADIAETERQNRDLCEPLLVEYPQFQVLGTTILARVITGLKDFDQESMILTLKKLLKIKQKRIQLTDALVGDIIESMIELENYRIGLIADNPVYEIFNRDFLLGVIFRLRPAGQVAICGFLNNFIERLR